MSPRAELLVVIAGWLAAAVIMSGILATICDKF